MTQERFPQEVIEHLGSYVYCLVDPRDDRIFYIGKGVRNRVFRHADGALRDDADPTLKNETIQQIIKNGLEVKYYIIRHGLSKDEAFLVESVLINFLTYDNFNQRDTLTNIQGGHDQKEFGIASVEEIIDKYSTGSKGDYLYNGNAYAHRSKLVLDVVKDYVAAHPDATLESLLAAFNVKVKFNQPMIMTVGDALKTQNSAGIPAGNFSMNDDQRIHLSSENHRREEVVVWKYWPDRFFNGFLKAAAKQEYKIERGIGASVSSPRKGKKQSAQGNALGQSVRKKTLCKGKNIN